MSWEKLSRDLRFVALMQDADGVRVGGLTVLVDVYRVSASGNTLITGDALASEVGVNSGVYYYVLDASLVLSQGMYFAIFKTADAGVAQKEVPSAYLVGLADIQNLDATVSSRAAAADVPAAAANAAAVWDKQTEESVVPGSFGEYVGQIAPLVHAAALLNSAIASFQLAGSVGESIGNAGAAADPLLNPVPGAYAQGTAGYALGRIGRAAIQVTSPVSTSGIIELTRGDDYAVADGRGLLFTSSSWPDLTEVTAVTLTIRRRTQAFAVGEDDEVWLAVADRVASRVLGAGPQTVAFELTAAETAELEPSASAREPYAGKYDVQATLGGRVITLAVGVVKVVEDQTR